eukprot:Hpha_TRINITY_DN16956_c2_g1::TRINITY_DN16956_c2_g1_i6::g.54250::m.54250
MEWLSSLVGPPKEDRCPVCSEETGGGTHRCRALEQRVLEEGRRARASGRGASPQCSGGHEMVPSDHCGGLYAAGFVCNICGALIQGERWFCGRCSEDICFPCWSGRSGAAAAGGVKGTGRKKAPKRRKDEVVESSWQREREHAGHAGHAGNQAPPTPQPVAYIDDPSRDGGACPAHQGQRMTLFCMTLRTALCVKCLHQGRTPDGESLGDAVWLPFDDAAQDVRSFVAQQSVALRTRRQTLAERARQHTEAHDAARQQVAKATDEVRARFRELSAVLARREAELVGELQGVLTRYEQSCSGTAAGLDRALRGLDESLAVAHDVSTGRLSSRALLTNFEGIARSLSCEVSAPLPQLPPPCRCDVEMKGVHDAAEAVSCIGTVQAVIEEVTKAGGIEESPKPQPRPHPAHVVPELRENPAPVAPAAHDLGSSKSTVERPRLEDAAPGGELHTGPRGQTGAQLNGNSGAGVPLTRGSHLEDAVGSESHHGVHVPREPASARECLAGMLADAGGLSLPPGEAGAGEAGDEVDAADAMSAGVEISEESTGREESKSVESHLVAVSELPGWNPDGNSFSLPPPPPPPAGTSPAQGHHPPPAQRRLGTEVSSR